MSASAEIELRLINWGRWSRQVGGRGAKSSPLYSLMLAHGSVTIEQAPTGIGIDAADAEAMERLIVRRCGKGEREMLIMLFVRGLSRGKVCHEFNIPRRRLERVLDEIFLALEDGSDIITPTT